MSVGALPEIRASDAQRSSRYTKCGGDGARASCRPGPRRTYARRMRRSESGAYAAVAPVLRQLVGTLESLQAVPLPLARYRRPPGRVTRLLDRAIGKPPTGDGALYRVTGGRAWPLT